ncbi:hypothetical protein BGW37DRAFT_487998 [Umbelopsis sp. PMI_123]|nr:hypothetical protein BGW37DRAFT_487998 [Umbelopsis sp. PMI_123]
MPSFQKIVSRVTESRWSKLYIATACLQAFVIILLQASILYENTQESNQLPNASPIGTTTSSSDVLEQAAVRFRNIKWENLAFCGFQIWFLGMAVDATVYQNTAEILALAVLNGFCAVLGAFEIVDGVIWIQRIGSEVNVQPLSIARNIEIGLTCAILLFASGFAYLSLAMVRQFGWNIYKKIGADIRIQRMYRIFQFFVLALKIDIFLEFMVSLFYIIQFGLRSGITWETGIQLVVTILLLPMLYFSRMACSTESIGQMITCICFQGFVVVHFSLILHQTFVPNNNWYVWICLVWAGIALTVVTSVLGAICLRNFEKGLKPFVQRGRNKSQKDLEMNNQQSIDEWKIDDI